VKSRPIRPPFRCASPESPSSWASEERWQMNAAVQDVAMFDTSPPLCSEMRGSFTGRLNEKDGSITEIHRPRKKWGRDIVHPFRDVFSSRLHRASTSPSAEVDQIEGEEDVSVDGEPTPITNTLLHLGRRPSKRKTSKTGRTVFKRRPSKSTTIQEKSTRNTRLLFPPVLTAI
jgi:hypothetical protein